MALALHPRVRALTTPERLAILAAALAVFFFGAGPVWRHPWEPDAAILWSYAVIPAGALAAFLRRGTPRVVPVLVESLLLSVAKFGISTFVLVALWSFGTPPPVRTGGPLDNVWRPKSTKVSSNGEEGEGIGEARRAGSGGAAAALAARLAAAQTVGVGDRGFSSKLISLARGQDVALEATDGRLHALELLSADGSIGANVPLLATGAPRLMTFEEISRYSSIRCAIHPEERADLSAAPRR